MKKVIIIGAGPAGITAGYELLKQSDEYEVTILEETPYIGGISRTEIYNGHRMDIGGHRFFSKSEEVNNWWNQIMPMQGAPAYDDAKLGREIPLSQGGPDPEKTDRVMLNRSRVSHIYYNRKFFEYPIKMNMNTLKNMGLGTTMQAGFSYLGSMVAKKPESSLENFYINQFGKKLYSMFFEGYTEKLWGRHPREIDPSWGAQRTKGLSITEIVKDATRKVFHKETKEVNTSLIEAFKYPKYGPGQLWEAAASDFEAMGGSIHTNCRVIRINTNGNQVESVTCAVDGVTIEEKADIIISSMPVKDLIVGMTNVPPKVTEIAKKLPYRDFVTIGLLVPKLRVNNTTYVKTLGNVIPDTWIYVQDTGVKMGRIQIFNNWSPYLLENPEKTIWLGLEYFCNEGDRYWNMTEEEWVSYASKELMQMGILAEGTKILDSHKVSVKKAYPAYFDSYSQFGEVRSYLDSFENLYCVGRNGQHRYNNMDHSMITSFEAVKNIICGIKDKSNIWNVNTEQEYHEEKSASKAENNTGMKQNVSDQEVKVAAAVQPEATVQTETVKNANAPVQADAATAGRKQEEEIKATVQAVPTPPVRKQLRRNPLPKAEAQPANVQENETVTVNAQVAEPVVTDAEIHMSKSRSIWDDVAYAEAISEVKTVPIRFKSVEEAHAAVKENATAVVSVENESEEIKPVEVKAGEKEIEKPSKSKPAKAKPAKAKEGAEAAKKPAKAKEEAEAAKKPAKAKEEAETAKKTAKAKEEAEAAKKTAETKPETKKRTSRKKAVAESAEEKVEEAKPEEGKPSKAKEGAEDAKKPAKAKEEAETTKKTAKAKEEAETTKKTAKAKEGAEAAKKPAKAKEEAEAAKKTAETKPETKKRTSRKKAVAETAEEKVEEAKQPSARSASGKTIAGRSASRKVTEERNTSTRRRVEDTNKKPTNVGKEAVIGSMKGTVIKEKVILNSTDKKTPSATKKK